MPGLEAAKAYIAFVGSVAVALLGVFTGDTVVGQVLTVIVVIATAITTYQVPNQPKVSKRRNEGGYVRGDGGGPYWIYVVGIVLLVLILLVVIGVIHVG